MELVVAQVVGAVPVAQPGQLEQVRGLAVAEVNDDKAAVVGVDAAGLGQAERFLVKGEGTVQITDVEIVVCKGELHRDKPPEMELL